MSSIAAIVVAIVAVTALITWKAEPFDLVLVMGPQDNALRAILASDSLIVAQGTGFMIAKGEKAGFVAGLYRGGAWLVLPSMVGGCAATAVAPKTAAVPRS